MSDRVRMLQLTADNAGESRFDEVEVKLAMLASPRRPRPCWFRQAKPRPVTC